MRSARPRAGRVVAGACLLLGTLALGGCAETRTIRQLGFPVFEPLTGANTRFVRPDPQQTRGLDAYPDDAAGWGDHRSLVRPFPAGTTDTVDLVVVAAPGPEALPLTGLAVAAYPLASAQVGAFAQRGTLPDPGLPLAYAQSLEPDADGAHRLLLRVPRADIPAGAERLAFPILVRFQDGWIHVSFYHSNVPPPLEEVLREVEARKAEQATQATQPPGD